MTDLIAPPPGLDEQARFAWDRMLAGAARDLFDTDVLALEAAARAWSRWRALEERIATMSAGNVLAGEIAKGASGALQVSALRQAANDAWRSFREIAREYGFAPPSAQAPVPETDLFGYPDRPGRGQRGRPRFHPAPRDRNRVRLLLACGWSIERIASAVEISVPTLRRHFRAELAGRDAMRDRLDARMLELAAESANAGNVSGLKELQRLVEKNDLVLAEARFGASAPEERSERPEKIGKKEARERAAADADADLMEEIEREAAQNVRH